MQLVLLGPPGAGKGTQADALVKKLFIPHISTGEIFRAAISMGTAMGKEAKSYLDEGKLVPDEITVGIIKDRLSQADCRAGFLLDGFPRTLQQAKALDVLLKELELQLTKTLNIEAPPDLLIVRLTGRRMCSKCGAIYHLLYNAPQNEGFCDVCGGSLYQRSDDSEETVRRRLDVYKEQTEPLIEYYFAQGLLARVNGALPMNEVLLALGQALGQKWN
ncbi:MAG: adenylate kinase [Firmicutes bacterium]|nr:adenylate kinase [Bacillota bacterium]